DNKEEVWLASADWMERSFFRRVEIAFPVTHAALRARVTKEALETYLGDNTQAWELRSDGNYRRCTIVGDNLPLSAQDVLLKTYAAAEAP
ncbi:MAG TPA: hypothetical protein VIW69_08020, partial [Candidatus Elarobacter sp.]